MLAHASYSIAPTIPLLSHWKTRPFNVGDYIQVDSDKLNMQVKSGDYFITLATRLELISQRLADEHDDTAINLEGAVNELLYLQNFYSIVKKQDGDN